MLSRKNYKAIAQIIRNNRPVKSDNDYSNGKNHAITDVSRQLAEYFEQNNPRFDRQKFYNACFED